jgi:hypothetical protein
METDKKKEDPKKKGVLGKLKDNLDDKEEQLAFISVIVRLVVVGWSSFGVEAARKRGDGTMKMDKNQTSGFNKADFEKLIEKAAQTAPTQILRIEQAPIKIVTEVSDKDNVSKA